MEEARRGNPDTASRRLEAPSHTPVLAITDAILSLSKALLEEEAVHGMDFLLG